MFITMNRFQIAPGRETEFEEIWRTRETFLDEVDGFVEFRFLRGEGGEYISHSTWESKAAFERWVGSEPFKKAHARAHDTPQDIFAGPARLSTYDVVISQKK